MKKHLLLSLLVCLGISSLSAQTDVTLNIFHKLSTSDVHLNELEGIYLNGHPETRLPGNLNVSVAGVDGSALLLGLQPTVAVSSGAACTSTKIAPSHVIVALGRDDKLAFASLRFGIGRFNTIAQIDMVAQQAIATIQSLRQSQTVLLPMKRS